LLRRECFAKTSEVFSSEHAAALVGVMLPATALLEATRLLFHEAATSRNSSFGGRFLPEESPRFSTA
jgi:hypothetical protein